MNFASDGRAFSNVWKIRYSPDGNSLNGVWNSTSTEGGTNPAPCGIGMLVIVGVFVFDGSGVAEGSRVDNAGVMVYVISEDTVQATTKTQSDKTKKKDGNLAVILIAGLFP